MIPKIANKVPFCPFSFIYKKDNNPDAIAATPPILVILEGRDFNGVM